MNEAQLKRYLIKEARSLGCYALRVEHQYMVGVPDILLKHPKHEWMWVEVKWLGKETSKDTYPNRASGPQRRVLKEISEVNGCAWLLTITKHGAIYNLRFTQDFDSDPLNKEDAVTFTKKYGKSWPVSEFLLALAM